MKLYPIVPYQENNITWYIGARRSGKTTKLIEAIVSNIEAGNDCVVVCPYMSNCVNIIDKLRMQHLQAYDLKSIMKSSAVYYQLKVKEETTQKEIASVEFHANPGIGKSFSDKILFIDNIDTFYKSIASNNIEAQLAVFATMNPKEIHVTMTG